MGVPSAAGSWDAEDDFLLKNAVEVTAIEPSSTSRTSIGPYPDALPEFPLARRCPDFSVSRAGLIAAWFPYAGRSRVWLYNLEAQILQPVERFLLILMVLSNWNSKCFRCPVYNFLEFSFARVALHMNGCVCVRARAAVC
jgi:hypothetical protein